MKRLMTTLICSTAVTGALLIAQSSFAQPSIQAEPTQVPATFSKIYVPVGFDSNDNVQFVGEGIFNNSCFRPAPTTLAVDPATKTIKVGAVAYRYNGICLQVLLPFSRVVDVGILAAGTWQIVGVDGKRLGQIKVAPTLTADPDDYLYAPVSQAYVRQTRASESLILNGTFPNSCMSMQEVRVNVTDDVVIVQPIAQMIDKSACKGGPKIFTHIVNLPLIKAGRYLLHVRSMNGAAVNSLVDLQ